MAKAKNRGVFLQHALYRSLRFLAIPFFTWRFALTSEKQPKGQGPYLVVANHCTELDFIFVSKAFHEPLGYVVGSGLLQNKLLSFVLLRLLGCIPKKKGAVDAGTTLGVVRRLRQGRNVCLFAEGNTCFDGRTDQIAPATGTLVKAARATLVTCRIEGGYFALPRWGRGIRRGKVHLRIMGVYPKEKLEALDAKAVQALMEGDLFEDAYQRQEEEQVVYKGQNLAGGIEHVLYCCPGCQGMNTLRGQSDQVICCHCGPMARYRQDGFFEGNRPFRSVQAWTDWQRGQLMAQAEGKSGQALLWDEGVQLLRNEDQPRLLAEGRLLMDLQHLQLGEHRFELKALQGFEIYRKNVLQFSTQGGEHFQTSAPKGFNALKYRDLYRFVQGRME